MIRIAPIEQVYGSMMVWFLVKRLRDYDQSKGLTDGSEYLVCKTANAEPLIYRAVDGRLKPTGETFVRWGISDDLERDLIRIPARGRKS